MTSSSLRVELPEWALKDLSRALYHMKSRVISPVDKSDDLVPDVVVGDELIRYYLLHQRIKDMKDRTKSEPLKCLCVRYLSVTNSLKELELHKLSVQCGFSVKIGHLRHDENNVVHVARKSRGLEQG